MRDLCVPFDSLKVHCERSVNDSSMYAPPPLMLPLCCNSRPIRCVNPIKTFRLEKGYTGQLRHADTFPS